MQASHFAWLQDDAEAFCEDKNTFKLWRNFVSPNILIVGSSSGVQCLFLETADFSAMRHVSEDINPISQSMASGEPLGPSNESQAEVEPQQDGEMTEEDQRTPPRASQNQEGPRPLEMSNASPSRSRNSALGEGDVEEHPGQGLDRQGDESDLPPSPESSIAPWRRVTQDNILGSGTDMQLQGVSQDESLAARKDRHEGTDGTTAWQVLQTHSPAHAYRGMALPIPRASHQRSYFQIQSYTAM